MQRLLLKITIAILTISLNSIAMADPWDFAVFGDTRADTDTTTGGVNNDAVIAIATDIINNRNCEFILIPGDLVKGEYAGWDTLEDQLQTFKDTASAAGLKLVGSSGTGLTYYPVRGNHETYSSISGDDDVEVWRGKFDTLPQNGPTTASGGGGVSEMGLTYSFTYENVLILAIDQYVQGVPKTNQDWVDEQLIGNTGHVFAFGHEPAYQARHSSCLASDQTERDTFLTSLYNAGGYGGKIYFAGHDHFNAIARVYEKDPDNGGTQDFYQIIIGSGGAPSKTFSGTYNTNYPGDYDVTGFYHDSDTGGDPPFHYGYAIVTVDDESLWLKLYGTEDISDPDWLVLYTLVISGTLEGDTDTLTSDIANDATLAFHQAIDGTYSGVIKGRGNLIKNGEGILTLSGDNTYTGTTTINEGTLSVTGTSSSTAVTVNSGGTLKGTGTVSSISNSGTVKPGTSIGTLNLNGGVFTQSADGTLEIEIASTSSFDNITGASTASLDGTLETITSGSYSLGDTLSGVIQTTGGITGSFATLQTQITPTIIWQPAVNGNKLDLVATRNYNNYQLKATLTQNEKRVAVLMEDALHSASGDLAQVKGAIDSLSTNAAVKDAYSQISPQKLNGFSTLSFSNTEVQFSNLENQMSAIRTGANRGFSYNKESYSFSGSLLNGVLIAYNEDGWGKFVPRDSQQAKELGNWGLFINGNGRFGDQEATDNQPGFDYSSWGISAGADYSLTDNFIAGLSCGYTGTSSDLGGSGGDVYVDTVPFGIYGTYHCNNFYLDGTVSYSLNFYDFKRTINFGGLDREAKGDTFGQQLGTFFRSGYDFKTKNFILSPFLTLQFNKLWIDSFTETNAGSLSAHIGDQSAASLQLGLGGRISHAFKYKNKTITPNLYVSYQHEFLDDSRSIEANLSQGGGVFQIETDDPERNFALVGYGLNIELTKSAVLYFDYETQVGQSDYTAHTINGALHIYF